MYPTLYHAFLDLFGLDLPGLKLMNSFGFFVAMAFIVASFFMTKELKRREEEGYLAVETRKITVGQPVSWFEVASNALIGFIIGWKILYLLLNAGELFKPGSMPQEFIFSLDGSILWGLVLALAFGVWRWYDSNKKALPEPLEKTVAFHKYEYVGNMVLVAAIGGISGAKLFHLFENPVEFMQFFKEPSLDNFLSGLTIYGGLIVGGLAVILYSRKKGIPLPHLLDSAAPTMILGYGVGRVGCQVSGDGDWGIANPNPKPDWMGFLPDWMWSYNYPNNVNAVRGPSIDGYTGKLITEADPWPIYEGYGTYLDPGVFPTPFYETVMTIIIFLFLWYLRKRIRIPYIIFSIYLMFNGIERFFIEKIRVNNVFDLLGMKVTQAEVISTIFFLAGLAWTIWLVMNKEKLVKKFDKLPEDQRIA